MLLIDALFLFKKRIPVFRRILIILSFIAYCLRFPRPPAEREISVLVYNKSCIRVLLPIVAALLKQAIPNGISVKVIQWTRIPKAERDALKALGCQVAPNYLSLLKACHQPQGKILLCCLDHQLHPVAHKTGCKTVKLVKKYGVKTITVQHGGTTHNSVQSHATFSSDIALLWGKKMYRDLVEKYQVDETRLRLIGNPCLDQVLTFERAKLVEKFRRLYPDYVHHLTTKRVIMLATCTHNEYDNDVSIYQHYLTQVYHSIDYSTCFLMVKIHPHDGPRASLYYTSLPDSLAQSHQVLVVPDADEALNAYELLYLSDLLITRSSTLAEESLVLGKNVIAFDLYPDGPSICHQHLAQYSRYQRVVSQSPDPLRETIRQVLFEPAHSPSQALDEEAVSDLAFSLDGNASQRAVNVILEELDKTLNQNKQPNKNTPDAALLQQSC